jgi:aminomethyltransferase
MTTAAAALKRTPFHARTSELCLPQNWRRWAGHIAVGSYDLGLEREYWAIRDGAALIDVSPLMIYLIEGPAAARLLDRITPRNIATLAVGQRESRSARSALVPPPCT